MSDEVVMCEMLPDRRATMRYIWEWGEEGACSVAGKQLLEQRAVNLKRKISFVPFATVVEPVTRDERRGLIADKLAAEGERDDALKRCTDLYNQNTQLSAELRNTRVRLGEKEAQAADLQDVVLQLREEVSRSAIELRETSDHLARANILLEAGPGETERELASVQRQLETATARIAQLQAELDTARQ